MSKLVRGIVFSAAIALPAMGFGPAFAQEPPPLDLTPISLACIDDAATAESCSAAIEALIASLMAAGLTPDQIDAALGQVAAILAEASLVPGANAAILAAALMQVAAAVTDPAQATAILEIAQAVASGTDIAVGAITPPPASPE